MGKNKVKFGLSNCVVAPFTINPETGAYVYQAPIAIPGAVNLNLSPVGDSNDFYADNVIYHNSTANQGYEGDLELALIPDIIRTKILGETVDVNGAMVENASDKPSGFAFGFQVDGDQNNRKFWYYNCSLARPANETGTKEASVTPKTETLTIKAMPRLSDQAVRVYMEPTDDNMSIYNSFFESVYEKVQSI